MFVNSVEVFLSSVPFSSSDEKEFWCMGFVNDAIDETNDLQLSVTYKSGMRKCVVFYNKDIVFPPSLTATSKPKELLKVNDVTLFGENGMSMLCTQYFRALAGPSDDFYIGSTYESSPDTLIKSVAFDKPTV